MGMIRDNKLPCSSFLETLWNNRMTSDVLSGAPKEESQSAKRARRNKNKTKFGKRR